MDGVKGKRWGVHFNVDPNPPSLDGGLVKAGCGGGASGASAHHFNPAAHQIEISTDELEKRKNAFVDKLEEKENDYKLSGEIGLNDLDGLKKQFSHIVGTTTFSGQLVDEDVKIKAKEQLKSLLLEKLLRGETVLLVSGATNLGGVKDTYDLLDDFALKPYVLSGQLKSMGLVAGIGLLSSFKSQSKENPYGIRKTDYIYIHEGGDGWRDDLNANGKGGWGAESPTFMDFITELVAFGGGDQAASEIAGVSEKGKSVTVLLGVKNGAKIDGEAELKVRAAKICNGADGKKYVEDLRDNLQQKISEGGDTKALEKLLKVVNKALSFTLSDNAKSNIKVVNV